MIVTILRPTFCKEKLKKVFVLSWVFRIFGERQDSSLCSHYYYNSLKIRLGCLHLRGVLVSWRIPAPQPPCPYLPSFVTKKSAKYVTI